MVCQRRNADEVLTRNHHCSCPLRPLGPYDPAGYRHGFGVGSCRSYHVILGSVRVVCTDFCTVRFAGGKGRNGTYTVGTRPLGNDLWAGWRTPQASGEDPGAALGMPAQPVPDGPGAVEDGRSNPKKSIVPKRETPNTYPCQDPPWMEHLKRGSVPETECQAMVDILPGRTRTCCGPLCACGGGSWGRVPGPRYIRTEHGLGCRMPAGGSPYRHPGGR